MELVPLLDDFLEPSEFDVDIPDFEACNILQDIQIEVSDFITLPSPTIQSPETVDLDEVLEWVIECEEAALATKTSSPSHELSVQSLPLDPGQMPNCESPSKMAISIDEEEPTDFRHELDMVSTVDRLFEEPDSFTVPADHSYAVKFPLELNKLINDLLTQKEDEMDLVTWSNDDGDSQHEGPSSAPQAVELALMPFAKWPFAPPPPAALPQRRRRLNKAKNRVKCYERKRKRCCC